MSELPMGWESVTVGGVCSVAPSDPPLAPDAPFIPMASVEVGLRYPVSTELRGDRGGIRARAGDLLFARITPCLENEKVAVVPPDLAVVGGSTEFIVVRPPTGVASSILYYWSLHPLVRSHARERMAGTTGRMRLSSSDLAEAPFWLPPTREQERIVTAIEEAFSKLDAGEAGLRAVRQLLKRMREAVLAAAVTGCLVPQDATETPATELLADLGISLAQEMHEVPATWAWAALGSLLREPLRNGMSAVKADASDGLPTFSITAVTTGAVSYTHLTLPTSDLV